MRVHMAIAFRDWRDLHPTPVISFTNCHFMMQARKGYARSSARCRSAKICLLHSSDCAYSFRESSLETGAFPTESQSPPTPNAFQAEGSSLRSRRRCLLSSPSGAAALLLPGRLAAAASLTGKVYGICRCRDMLLGEGCHSPTGGLKCSRRLSPGGRLPWCKVCIRWGGQPHLRDSLAVLLPNGGNVRHCAVIRGSAASMGFVKVVDVGRGHPQLLEGQGQGHHLCSSTPQGHRGTGSPWHPLQQMMCPQW